MHVKVAYFARVRELAGVSEEEITLNTGADVEHLFSEVLRIHPKLSEIKQIIRTLVNGCVMLGNVSLKEGDNVTLLPAVGGG